MTVMTPHKSKTLIIPNCINENNGQLGCLKEEGLTTSLCQIRD